ncbi:MAG: hypothetical protein M5R41_19195 [Bacteroidia bacterium]|nr:hypothetical protein [Bacteroidia bacterium]
MDAERQKENREDGSSSRNQWIGHAITFIIGACIPLLIFYISKPQSPEDQYVEKQLAHFPKLLSKDTARVEGTATHTIALTIAMEKWQNRFDSARWENKARGMNHSPIPNIKWFSEAEIVECVVPITFRLVNESPDEPAVLLFEVAGSVDLDTKFHPYDALIAGKWTEKIDTLELNLDEIVPADKGEHIVNCMLRLNMKKNSSRVYYFAVYKNASDQYFYTHCDIICKYDIPLDSLIKLRYQPGKPTLNWVVDPSREGIQSLVPFIQVGSNYYDTIPYDKVDRLMLALEQLARMPVREDSEDEKTR